MKEHVKTARIARIFVYSPSGVAQEWALLDEVREIYETDGIERFSLV